MRQRQRNPYHDKDRDAAQMAWSNYTLGQKMRYIWSYYHWWILLCLVLLLLGLCMVLFPGKRKVKEQLYVEVLDSSLSEKETKDLQNMLAASLSAKPSAITIGTSYENDSSGESLASAAAYMRSGRVDILLAPEAKFNTYAVSGYLKDLSKIDGGKMIVGRKEEDLFYAVPADYSAGPMAESDITYAPHTKSADSICCGIYLKNSSIEGYCLGILSNSPHTKNALRTAEYLAESDRK